MLQNAYFLAKIGADAAENEQHFAEILPIGRRVADRCRARGAARTRGAPRRSGTASVPAGAGAGAGFRRAYCQIAKLQKFAK